MKTEISIITVKSILQTSPDQFRVFKAGSVLRTQLGLGITFASGAFLQLYSRALCSNQRQHWNEIRYVNLSSQFFSHFSRTFKKFGLENNIPYFAISFIFCRFD